uniref:C-C motif chemokine 20 n=1 Tax=Esox lucius TaxID=8010 RepID=C1BYQ3_ESOLU|nr:chemokine (C-C motif) ligand 20 precursor [Esox lucius]ACO14156.1 C-C motif chemokine 20 precursor [Esox lucius]
MAQMRAPVKALLMILAVGLFTNSEAQQGCCMSYSTGRIPFNRIRGYSIQTVMGRCNINAIIFHSVQERNICVDPTEGWVMANIRKLREKAERLNKKKSQG